MVNVILGISAIIVAWIIGYFTIPNKRTYIIIAIIVTIMIFIAIIFAWEHDNSKTHEEGGASGSESTPEPTPTSEPTPTFKSTPEPIPTFESTPEPTPTLESTPEPTTGIDLTQSSFKTIPPEAENAAIRARNKAAQARNYANTAREYASEALNRFPNYDLTDGVDYDNEFMVGGSSTFDSISAGQRYNVSGISYVVTYKNGQPEIEGQWYNDQSNESLGVPYYVVYWWESGCFEGQLKTYISSLNVDPAGIFTFTDGSYYEGEFYIGSPYIFDGWGIMYNSDGSINRAGSWQGGIFVDGTTFP